MTSQSFYNPGLSWQCFRLEGPMQEDLIQSRAIERRLERILHEWRGTPYMAGQAVKGVGVFCSAFTCRVLDELYHQDPTPLPEIPDDASFHDPETSARGLRWFLKAFPNHLRVENGIVQPADVVVTGPRSGGPGHAILVGPQENTLWEANVGKVAQIGLVIPQAYELHAIYRMSDRRRWLP